MQTGVSPSSDPRDGDRADGDTSGLDRAAPAPSPDAVLDSGTAPRPATPVTVEEAPRPAASVRTAYQKWICITCGHIYDEALGDEHEGIAPGTLFGQIPDDWRCPDCGAAKGDYVLYEEK